MKNIIKSLCAATILLAAAGCDQDQIVTTFDPAGEDAKSAYFVQNTLSHSFEANTTGDQTVDVVLYRQNAAGMLAVDLTAKSTAARFFEGPQTVVFQEGEFSVKIPVTVKNVQDFAIGATYSLTLSVPTAESEARLVTIGAPAPDGLPAKQAATRASAAQIEGKYSSVKLSATVTLNWLNCYILKDASKLLSNDLTEADYVVGPDGKPMVQTATYYYNFWWEGADDEIVLQRAQGTNVFRMANWGGGVDLIFQILPDQKLDGYTVCKLDSQYIGSDYSDGTKLMVSDPVSLGYPQGATVEDFPCLWDGEREFLFTLQYYLADGRVFNGQAQEFLVLSDGQSTL